MRQISFALTVRQFLGGTKTVTRRLGWKNLTPGTRLMGVLKCMGLKKGEKVDKLGELGELEVVNVRRERLDAITKEDCVAEGFPAHEPREFVEMLAKHNACDEDAIVTRIEFRRVSS